MIRFRYIPFTFGKPKFMSRESEPVSNANTSLQLLLPLILDLAVPRLLFR